MLSEIISLFYPQICAGCKKPVHKSNWVICMTCRVKMPKTKFQFFDDNPVMQLLAGKCKVEHAFSFYYFKNENSVQDLMYALKYQGITRVGDEFGLVIGQSLSKIKRYESINYVIPLPLHVSKLRLRGFNQCDPIARGIANKINAEFVAKGIVRTRATESQTKKNHFDRHQNANKIFHVSNPKRFENKSVLLIDDIITTGSTLSSFIQVFNRISGCRVYVGTVAIAT